MTFLHIIEFPNMEKQNIAYKAIRENLSVSLFFKGHPLFRQKKK